VGLTITWKVFLAFCLVVLVVLALGLWSLHATGRLHGLNQRLVSEAIPALRLQRALEEQVKLLVRHEARAIVLRDPAYRSLHQEVSHEFQRDLETLAVYAAGGPGQEALGRVRARFADYLRLVEQEWDALSVGRRDEALRLSEGATREAAAALSVAVEALLSQSLADLESSVGIAGKLERSARIATMFSLAVSLAVGLGLAAMVAMWIARPIRALSRATQLVARGEFDVPPSAKSRDEVGDLSRAFGEMARQLREVDQLTREVLANISHDFRSPLASIRMAASLLHSGSLGPKEERWLQIIHSDTDKLLRLTDDILQLSKLRARTLPLDLAPADLRDVAASAADEVRPVTVEKGVTLTIALPEPAPRLVCDEQRIQQVLANLLSNAVKFTPQGGEVRVTGRADGDQFLITVEDTGIGIPPSELPHIFDRYHQAHGRTGGTGLGLAIVKGLVEAHGGRVWAESREGEGSRFHVALPHERVSA
jgi:signal transduction histidine kinase